MSSFKTLDDLDDGRRVLVRLDLNSPVEDGEVQDNRRFDRHAETVKELADRDFQTVLMAHQGRPGRDTFVSLDQHADILADHIDQDVQFVADTFGEKAISAIDSLDSGEILLLENTRMCDEELPEEEPEVKAETEFVRTLAPEFDAYVDDAYSAAHRSHASIVGFPLVLPSYAGRVMETEYEANSAIAEKEFDGNVTMVVGGTKATDVIDVMSALDEKVDDFLLGGIAGELFLRADGHPVGHDVGGMDLFDEQWEQNQDKIESMLDEHRDQITLAVDLAYEDENSEAQRASDNASSAERSSADHSSGQSPREDGETASGERAEIAVDDIDEKTQGFLDVGSETVMTYSPIIRDSEAVFVKGALGLFEDERFSVGTVGALEAIAATDCFSVVGGGDTSRAIEMYGLSDDEFGHVSIAGGAYIRALTGQELIGVDVLERE